MNRFEKLTKYNCYVSLRVRIVSLRSVTFCDFLFKRNIFFQSLLKKYAPNTITQQEQNTSPTTSMSSKTYVSKAFDFFFKRGIFFQSRLKKYAPNTITQQGQERKTQKGRRILIKSFFSHLMKSDAEIISLIGFRSQGNVGTFPTKK